MMDDRELLELAAKACGYHYEWLNHTNKPATLRVAFYPSSGVFDCMDWNPIKDDSQALRLAVKLGLILETGLNSGKSSSAADVSCDHHAYIHDHGGEPVFGIRLAIVRAAAMIGESMEKSQ